MKKKENFFVRILKGWGYFIGGFIMTQWFCTVMLLVGRNSVLIKLFTGIAALMIINGLFFNYAHNAAVRDRDLVKFHGAEYDRTMPLKMSILVPLFHHLSWAALCLCKAGAIHWEQVNYAFNYYSLLNIHTLPWTAVITEGRTLEYLSVPGLIGLLIIDLLEPATITLTYILTMKSVDLKSFIYKKK